MHTDTTWQSYVGMIPYHQKEKEVGMLWMCLCEIRPSRVQAGRVRQDTKGAESHAANMT